MAATSATRFAMSSRVKPSGKMIRNGFGAAERVDELLGLRRLLAVVATQRQRQADDDAVGMLGADELDEALEPGVRADALDDTDRPREGSGGVGDGDARSGRAVVQRHDL